MDRFPGPISPTSAQLRQEKRADAAIFKLAQITREKTQLQIAMTKAIREAQERLGINGCDLVTELEETFLAEKSPFSDLLGDLWHAEAVRLKNIVEGVE